MRVIRSGLKDQEKGNISPRQFEFRKIVATKRPTSSAGRAIIAEDMLLLWAQVHRALRRPVSHQMLE